MRAILTAIFLATGVVDGCERGAPQAVAEPSVQELREEVKAKLKAKLAAIKAEADVMRLRVGIEPNLEPGERGRLRAELRRIEARSRPFQLFLVRVDRLSPRALAVLAARLPDIVSPA